MGCSSDGSSGASSGVPQVGRSSSKFVPSSDVFSSFVGIPLCSTILLHPNGVKNNDKIQNSTISDAWNNEYFKSIRKDFLAGKWPENCSRCKYVEEAGGISKRMDENDAASLLHKEY